MRTAASARCAAGLRANKNSMADRDLYIIGPDGADILGRRLLGKRRAPPGILPRIEVRGRPAISPGSARPPPSRSRPPVRPAGHRPAISAAARAAADRGAGRHGLHRDPGAAPPQHLRRAEPAGDLARHSLHRAGGERAHELVAGAAPERAHPAHSRGRARARLGESRCARERGPRGTQGRTRGSGARFRRHGGSAAGQSRRHHAAAARHLPRTALAAGADARGTGSRTPAARRYRASAGSIGARDRTARLADQPGVEARAPARHRRPLRARGIRPRRGDRGGGARRRTSKGPPRTAGCRPAGRRAAWCNGNRDLLRSAIENVLRNAVRYSPQDAPVEVAVARNAAGITISVRDRGPGVPAGGSRAHIRAVLPGGRIPRPRHAAARASVSPSPLRS